MKKKMRISIIKYVTVLSAVIMLALAVAMPVNAAKQTTGGVTTTPFADKIRTKTITPFYTQPDLNVAPKGIVPGGQEFTVVGFTSNNFYMIKCVNVYYYMPYQFCQSVTGTQPPVADITKIQTTQATQATQTHGKVYEISENQFKAEVLDYDGFVLVDFYAEWCGPCMRMKPSIEKIAKEHPEYKIVEINVDYCDNLCWDYNVSSIPALFFFKDGQVVYQTVGGRSERDLLKLIQTYSK